MKNIILILSVLFAMSLTIHAQIPNGGFEEWTTQDGIEIPAAPWITNNLQEKPALVSYNPVTKSTDHYPENSGSYSLRMENNILYTSESGEILPYWACSYGYTTTAFYPGYNGPVFPVTGHPDTLHGYYKFLPQNNDTMSISIAIYYQGAMVSFASLLNATTITEWTAFSLPIPSYTVADSAQIGVTAFYVEPGKLPTAPYGNSVMYVDNFSFNKQVSAVADATQGSMPDKFELGQNYPNPFNPETVIRYVLARISNVQLDIYSAAGQKIRTPFSGQQPAGIHTFTFNAAGLASGIYYYQITVNNHRQIRKMVLLK